MRAYELYENKREPKIGDSIDFPDDTITDKGPCSGSIRKIKGNSVWFSVSDTVFKTNWKKFTKKANVTFNDGCWTAINKDGAHEILIDYEIDGDTWSERGMPLKETEQYVSKSALDKLEQKLDRLYAKLGIDVEFTRHFIDRVNDERNKKPITIKELQKIFTKVFQQHREELRKFKPDFEAVMKDLSTSINIPFVIDWNGEERELISKTVMRKSDFHTSNDILPVN